MLAQLSTVGCLLQRHWLVTSSTCCQPGLCRLCFLSAELLYRQSVLACTASWGCSLPKTKLCACLWNLLVLSCPFLQPLEDFWKAAWRPECALSPASPQPAVACWGSVLFYSLLPKMLNRIGSSISPWGPPLVLGFQLGFVQLINFQTIFHPSLCPFIQCIFFRLSIRMHDLATCIVCFMGKIMFCDKKLNTFNLNPYLMMDVRFQIFWDLALFSGRNNGFCYPWNCVLGKIFQTVNLVVTGILLTFYRFFLFLSKSLWSLTKDYQSIKENWEWFTETVTPLALFAVPQNNSKNVCSMSQYAITHF